MARSKKLTSPFPRRLFSESLCLKAIPGYPSGQKKSTKFSTRIDGLDKFQSWRVGNPVNLKTWFSKAQHVLAGYRGDALATAFHMRLHWTRIHRLD